MSPLTNLQPRLCSILKSQTGREVKFPEYQSSNFSNLWETTDVRQWTQTQGVNYYLRQYIRSYIEHIQRQWFRQSRKTLVWNFTSGRASRFGCRLSFPADLSG
ncbi:Hypothetical_protein [Hexamita inflata]|uniref:Hypothetical_protein n=1 Tax=Hexamita inflata TaxID=28002 RepID=A0AA86R5S2_9EUKA|nr:Hypothetical protein HINF_LOCUS55314 [Hexamita inflata]CAI9967671.1 Hypothetical protein HINF_LOCUS55316 [Hexamita inflata]